VAAPLGAPGNIQAIPTPWIYVTHGGGQGCTNSIFAGLAHYWIGGPILDSVGGSSMTNSGGSDIVLNQPGGPITTDANNFTANAGGICPQFALVNFLGDSSPDNSTNMTGGPGNSFSAQLWIKPLQGASGYAGCQTVVDIWGRWNVSTSDKVWRFVRGNTGSGIQFRVWDSTNQVEKMINLTTAGPTGNVTNWTHLVVTYNDATTNLLGYSNGVLVASLAVAGVTNTTTALSDLPPMEFFNGALHTPGSEYVGALADAGWWTNTVLSSNDVARIYNFGVGWPYPQFSMSPKSWPAPVALENSGLVRVLATFPGNIFVSFDGSTPNNSSSPVSQIPYSISPPSGSYLYDGQFAELWTDNLVKVRGTNKCGKVTVNTFSLLSIGELWSNNVVANGGANPSSNTATNINIFGASCNNGFISTNFVGCNLIATDSLIAATTPIVYPPQDGQFVGPFEPWFNSNFTTAALTVNGLTGNGVTNFLNTSLNPSVVAGTTKFLTPALYVYKTNGVGNFDYGAFESSGGNDLFLAASVAHNAFYANRNPRGADPNTTSPGQGFYAVERTAAALSKMFFANSGVTYAQFGTNDTAVTTAYPNLTMDLFALNGGIIPELFTSNTVSFASLEFTLAGSSSNLFNAVQAFRTAEGGGFR